MRFCTTFFILLFIQCNIFAYNAIYKKSDSISIENILKKLQEKEYKTTGDIVLAVAREFIGTPYVSGTLDKEPSEHLVVNTKEVDCTTFVEQIIAIVLTHKQKKSSFHSFCDNLERIRYRNGICNGYASRLHYISQWICDSAKHDDISEIIGKAHTATQHLSLDFMSKHPDSYKQLKENKELIKEIEHHELPFRDIDINYIPKKTLCKSQKEININDGDILALVTSVNGLDVSHVGFAFWENGKLHLLHASSNRECVIADEESLYDYQKDRKSHLGVRVFRIK